MRIRNLDTFHWIATLGSFRAAAEQLHLTQPAVTARIQVLEQDLGAEVFLKDTRKADLTAAGRTLLPYAEKLIELDQSVISLFSKTTTVEQTVRLGSSETIVGSWLPEFLAHYAKSQPNLSFDLSVDATNNLRNALVAREIDLAFLMGLIAEASIENTPLCEYQMVFSATPQVANKNKVWTLSDLAQESILTFSSNTRPHREIKELLKPLVMGKLPIDQQALAADLQSEGLLPSARVYDRLVQHQRHIPENQGEFDHFWSQIGGDVAFYPEWGALRNNYDTARGNAAANRINQLIALYFPNGRPQGIDDAITIYQDDGFTGIRANLGTGTHNFVDLEASGVGNDDISSIRVGNGYTVVACGHSSNDSCRTYSASTATLGELNNSISIIEVRRTTGEESAVTVYGDNNFGGSNVNLPVGIYTLSDLVALRIGNDSISSIQVSDGFTVYACAHRAADGTCRSFSDSAATLGLLNNQISYIEVNRSVITEPTVTVYGNTNFGGTNVDLAVGTYTLADLNSLGIANDSISSVRVHNGFSVYACQHGTGGGVCRTYTESTNALGLLDNSISYIEVIR